MTTIRKGIPALFILALLVGCGKDKPLSPEQKAQVKELTSATNTVVSSATTASKNKTARAFVETETRSNAKMVDQISKGQCDFDYPKAQSSSLNINLRISGANCPIDMEWGMQAVSNEQVKVRMYFELKDPELAKLSDVTKYSLTGTLSRSSGTLTGSVLSKKYGEVGLEMDMSGSSSEYTVNVTYKFKDYEAKLRMEANKDGIKYFLNGEAVTQKDFLEFGGQSNVGASQSTSPSPQNDPYPSGSTASYSYEYTYNGCSTGTHAFGTLDELCNALQSSSVNHTCAEELRRSAFTSWKCPGTFTSKP